MNKITCFAVATVAGLLASSSSRAATDNTGLIAVATQYRDAVVNFERVVLRIRGIDRSDERTVDKFEDATGRLLFAAKNPRLASRFRNEWKKMMPMQTQVEKIIFGKYTPHHDLIRAWEWVLYSQVSLEEEYSFYLENPRHGNSVRRRIYSSQPNRYLPLTPTTSAARTTAGLDAP